MQTQYELFELTLDQRFDDWLASDHGQTVMRAVVSAARQIRARGRKRYGIKAIIESLRFAAFDPGRDPDGFKLNNAFTSRLARQIMRTVPELAGFFEVRKLISQDESKKPLRAVVVPLKRIAG